MPLLSRDDARAFIAARHQGVLVTARSSDGRAQLSNVAYALTDGRVRVSTTVDRAKAANVRRDPWAGLYVTSRDFGTYVVAEGEASLSAVARQAGDATCRALLELYETIRGEPHPDRDEFFRAMVDDRRVELSFPPARLYPLAG